MRNTSLCDAVEWSMMTRALGMDGGQLWC